MTAVASAYGESFFGEYTAVAEKWGDGQITPGDFTAPVGAGLDLLGAFVDPVSWIVGNLLDPIYNFIIENVPFVEEAIELVSGSPEQVQACGDMFKQASQAIIDQANQLVAEVNKALDEWRGIARDAFRLAADVAVKTQQGLSKGFEFIANLTYAFGVVVAAAKEFVISLLKELITQLVVEGVMAALAAVPSLGTAIAAYMAWASARVAMAFARVSRVFAKLLGKCAKLAGKGSKLGAKLSELSQKLMRVSSKASQRGKSWDATTGRGMEHAREGARQDGLARSPRAVADNPDIQRVDPGVADSAREQARVHESAADDAYKRANEEFGKVHKEADAAGYNNPEPEPMGKARDAVDAVEDEAQEAKEDGRFSDVDQNVDPLQ